MEKVLQQILDKLSGIDARLDKLDHGQARLELRIKDLELRMENEVIDKVKVLFDADKTRAETLKRIETKLDAHDARLDEQGGELTRLRVKR